MSKFIKLIFIVQIILLIFAFFNSGDIINGILFVLPSIVGLFAAYIILPQILQPDPNKGVAKTLVKLILLFFLSHGISGAILLLISTVLDNKVKDIYQAILALVLTAPILYRLGKELGLKTVLTLVCIGIYLSLMTFAYIFAATIGF